MTVAPASTDFPRINIADPVHRFLTRRLRLSLFTALLLMVSINVIRVVVIPYLHHRALGSDYFQNANLTDGEQWLISFITQPVILFVYWKLVDFIPKVFGSLIANGVVRPRTGQSLADFMRALERDMTHPFVNGLVLAGAVIGLVVTHIIGWSTAASRGPYGTYPYDNFQVFAIEYPYGFVRYAFLGWAIARSLLFVRALNMLWKGFDADIKPLHPDRAGGFAQIGKITQYFGLLVGACGVYITANFLAEIERGNSQVQIAVLTNLLALIVVAVPYAFFTPIWSTHRAMEKARLRQLDAISDRIRSLWEPVSAPSGASDRERLKELSGLQEMRNMTLSFLPVWPFVEADFRRYWVGLAPIWTVVGTFIAQALWTGLLARFFTLGQ